MSQKQGIPVVHKPDDAGYRLLELPMELESLLSSTAAPVLTIESSDDGSAVLRTPDKSYALRQKNTSNGLFLLAPCANASAPEQKLASVATIHETVELDVVPEHPVHVDRLADTGSRGKWHEKFGRGR